MPTDPPDVLTNVARPLTEATITVRVIKSFEYRTERSLVLHNIDLTSTTVGQLKQLVGEGAISAIHTQHGWRPFRNVHLDTLKLYTKAHGAKTTNLIINLDHDEWMLEDNNEALAECGFENETEVSFFNRDDYHHYKQNPQTRWD